MGYRRTEIFCSTVTQQICLQHPTMCPTATLICGPTVSVLRIGTRLPISATGGAPCHVMEQSYPLQLLSWVAVTWHRLAVLFAVLLACWVLLTILTVYMLHLVKVLHHSVRIVAAAAHNLFSPPVCSVKHSWLLVSIKALLAFWLCTLPYWHYTLKSCNYYSGT